MSGSRAKKSFHEQMQGQKRLENRSSRKQLKSEHQAKEMLPFSPESCAAGAGGTKMTRKVSNVRASLLKVVSPSGSLALPRRPALTVKGKTTTFEQREIEIEKQFQDGQK